MQPFYCTREHQLMNKYQKYGYNCELDIQLK